MNLTSMVYLRQFQMGRYYHETVTVLHCCMFLTTHSLWHTSYLYSSMSFFFTCLYFWEVWIMCMYILYTRFAISGMFLMIWSGCPEASLWVRETKKKTSSFWINTVMQKEWQWINIPVSLAVVVNYWCDAIAQWNYNSSACYLLLIWKQISHFLPPVFAPHVASKGVERMQRL